MVLKVVLAAILVFTLTACPSKRDLDDVLGNLADSLGPSGHFDRIVW